MAEALVKKLGSGGSIIWAIAVILFGLLAIALPLATAWGLVIVAAWVIIFSAGFQFVHAFRSQGVGQMLWKLLVAVLYVVFGVYLLTHPLLGVAAFTLALAFLFMAEGVMDLGSYFHNRGMPGAGWVLFDGIISLILGLAVWRHWPSGSFWIIGTLLGINMIFTGLTRLMLGLAARKVQGDSPAKAA